MINDFRAGNNVTEYRATKLKEPTVRRFRSVENIYEGYRLGRVTMNRDEMWLQRLTVYLVDPNRFDACKTLYLGGWFGTVLNLEIDFAGDTWIENLFDSPNPHPPMAPTGSVHHLHFGEIKSSPSLNLSKGGITQLIRLGFMAMKTMELLGEAEYIRVEATIFINDDEVDFNFVSDFDPVALRNHAIDIIRALKYTSHRDGSGRSVQKLPMPENAQFILSYQKIRHLGEDTRDGSDGYGVILQLYDNIRH